MFKRVWTQIKDGLYEKTYRELYEEQNILLDKQKLEIRRLNKKIMRLELEKEKRK